VRFTSGLLLAAGASTRFGSVKMLAHVEGQPLLRRIASVFLDAGLDEVVVVLGARSEEVGVALEGLPVRRVENPDWPNGMLSSAKAGLSAVDPRSDRIAICPADLVHLRAETVKHCVEASADAGPRTVTLPRRGDRRGHPLVVPAALVPKILELTREQKLSDVLRLPGVAVYEVEVEDDGVLHDVDRPEDLVRV
jgi:molybdenum cofactor cytidylyltransferase